MKAWHRPFSKRQGGREILAAGRLFSGNGFDGACILERGAEATVNNSVEDCLLATKAVIAKLIILRNKSWRKSFFNF